MKIKSQTNLLMHSSFALALAFSLLTSVTSQSAEPAVPAENSASDGKMMMGGKMMTESELMQHCQAMKGQAEKMMADMKEQDTEINAEVAKMNAAPEDKKLELMSTVVTRMVEQRTAMHARMETMQAGMMNHMMQHVQMGNESMAQCPMMKGMHDKSTDDHKEHKAE